MPSRILIIHPEGNFANNPNLNGLLHLMGEAGYRISFHAVADPRTDQSPLFPEMDVVTHDKGMDFTKSDFRVAVSGMFSSARDLKKHILSAFGDVRAVIGIDRGVIEASAIAGFLRVPLGAISYELFFEDELSAAFKLPERLAYSQVGFAACQDALRSRYLAKENRFSREKIVDIPVAGRGLKAGELSRSVHKVFDLPEHVKLALYMGEIDCGWSGAEAVIRSTPSWPEEWMLLLHHRYSSHRHSSLVEEMRERGGKIAYSPFPNLPIQDMGRLLHAVDVGLSFYVPEAGAFLAGKNLQHIGMASGKISTYFQYGVPVISSDAGEIGRYIQERRLGAVVDGPERTGEALGWLNAEDMDQMRRNCKTFFSERLDVERQGREWIDRLGSAVRGEPGLPAAMEGPWLEQLVDEFLLAETEDYKTDA